jgi:hypothetical protein
MAARGWIVAVLLLAAGVGLSILGEREAFQAPLTGIAEAQTRPPGAKVVLAYSVGGVLTADGNLWQYRPDQERWLLVDEAFRQEGRETHILPLPVAADDIRQMESFGFIVTKAGDTWLYEVEPDKWRKLTVPA